MQDTATPVSLPPQEHLAAVWAVWGGTALTKGLKDATSCEDGIALLTERLNDFEERWKRACSLADVAWDTKPADAKYDVCVHVWNVLNTSYDPTSLCERCGRTGKRGRDPCEWCVCSSCGGENFFCNGCSM